MGVVSAATRRSRRFRQIVDMLNTWPPSPDRPGPIIGRNGGILTAGTEFAGRPSCRLHAGTGDRKGDRSPPSLLSPLPPRRVQPRDGATSPLPLPSGLLGLLAASACSGVKSGGSAANPPVISEDTACRTTILTASASATQRSTEHC